jgi:two-component system, LytTR family, sensor histidine kinase AlgZ
MHPILSDRRRLSIYLAGWAFLAILLAIIVMEASPVGFGAAVLLVLPPTMIFSSICLAAWYPARVLPLNRTPTLTLVLSHTITAAMLSGLWVLLIRLSARISDSYRPGIRADAAVWSRAVVFFATGILLYLLSVAFHYVLIAMTEAHDLEHRKMEVQVQAREAELKALRAQVDPHFLFNALNSIAALCGTNPSSARTVTTLLAEYLRKTLRAGSSETISLSEELELASSYLAIERVRFGPRLEFEQTVEESVRDYRLPPLLLQPLVENAVTHGVGQLVNGGVVRLSAHRNSDSVKIVVENRCDPDRAESRGTGIGLANTRRRVETYFGDRARVDVKNDPEWFRVELSLPL